MKLVAFVGATSFAIVSHGQRISDNCANRDKYSCILSTSGVYTDSTPCSGWCEESKQCLGQGATMCPLEEMAWEDYGFVSSIHWSAVQCTALVASSSTLEGWCQPNENLSDLSLGHCTEKPVLCDTSVNTLLTTPVDVPCEYRGPTCFDCLSLYTVDPTPKCFWCPTTQTCSSSAPTDCADAMTDVSTCPNSNRYREKNLKKKQRLASKSQ